MRKALYLAIILSAVACLVIAEDAPWFDLEKCAFCKTLADQPGLIDHMKTEYHNLHNGTMSFTHIDSAYQPAFANAQESMRPVIMDLQAGKQVYMCPHCTELGALMMAGVIPDQIKTGDGIAVIYTSNDSAMVARLQLFGLKSAAGLAAFKAAKK